MQTEQDGAPKTYRGRFLFFGTGYYNYDEPYNPEFPGIEQFSGQVVHPQQWPESLDYTGKRIVVDRQRRDRHQHDSFADREGRPRHDAAALADLHDVHAAGRPGGAGDPQECFRSGRQYRGALVQHHVHRLVVRHRAQGPKVQQVADPERRRNATCPQGYPVDVHFKPRYDPWDQRLCLILDNDLYSAVSDGRADVVTDQIDHVDASGIVLKSGKHIDADVIVTATGLQLQALGGVAVSIDGAEVKPQDRFVYKEHMLEDIPNMAWCVGYINASWTLRADLTARAVAKLLSYMDSRGYTHAYPHLGDQPMPEKPAWNINAGYVQRAAHVLPKSGTHRPWNVRHNYVLDVIDHRFDRIEESMVFGRASQDAVKSA